MDAAATLSVLHEPTGYDLIFADAPAGKVDGLDLTIAALNPGGVLVAGRHEPSS